ncbi:hypothetical protein J14TS2_19280 [Bacillus sp. J14TS2]|uniref:response regulator transcription factor n=1 Tax=Bacillus sp. J14TS2 TaxID=2807188 RepID=UPI001B10C30B|nr:response regulator [Bacillus sp. J14TS2]GIN71453.1 hypothetical protein J14TS2_19280 [Bacillus sp. J14TS2]
MWTVLLVEDEVFVRESIRELIEWERFGFTVVGEAGDGQEALKIIRELEPDLVISDIRMPILDGIELLKTAKESGFDGVFLMLSCLNEFEYVRQAMEYGASNYILKLSMSVQSLREALEKLKIELLTRKGKGIKEIEQYYQNLWNVIHESTIVQGEYSLPSSLVKDYQLIIFSVLNGSTPFRKVDFYQSNHAPNKKEAIVHLFQTQGQTSVFYWSKREKVSDQSFISDISYPFVSERVGKDEKIKDTWKRALRKLDAIWYEVEDLPVYEGDTNQRLLKIKRDFVNLFEQMNKANCSEIIKKMWQLIERERYPMGIVKDYILELNRDLSQIAKRDIEKEASIIYCPFYHELKEMMTSRFILLFKLRFDTVGLSSDHHEINKVMDYVQQHYAEPLEVKKLAKHVALDSNYLSSLFKKKTGNSIIHYIHDVRIKHAKYALTHSRLPVSKIAEQVGFLNDNYFIKIFKRYTGQTPKHFRDRN